MATARPKAPLPTPSTPAGRLRQRARAAMRARHGVGAGRLDPEDSFEARRYREVLTLAYHGDSQTGIDPGDVAGPPDAATSRPLACPGFEEGARVSVTRLDTGDAKEIGVGTLLYDLGIGEACQVAIPDAGVLRTTPVRSASAIGADVVQIVTRRSTYRLRLRLRP